MKKITLITSIFTLFILLINLSVFSQEKNKSNGKTIIISTQMGEIMLKLYDETPLHRDNFIKLVSEHYFDSTLFHRVINNFMIQGGDPDSKNAVSGAMLGNGGPNYTIPAEFVPNLIHKKGVLAAAREGDMVNPQKASSGSQFYIVQGKVFTTEELDMLAKRMGKSFTAEQIKTYTTMGGTPHLDGAYTVFGEVISGWDVIDKIAKVTTDQNNRPKEDIRMFVKFAAK
jgi:cyclophilin family peptidyl-prolyl cis-trans isomerase